MSATAFRSMANVDGLITPTEQATVPVLDRGFLYGDSIYEVLRTYDGVPMLYDAHWARFENSASLIDLRIGLTREQMLDQIRATVAQTGAAAQRTDVYVRFAVTRGEGAIDLYPSPDLEPRYVIIAREAPKWREAYYTRGIDVAIVTTRRNPLDALDPNIKGGNYLNNVLGVMEARSLGADDCLMLNAAGQITEASNSNVFFVFDGELVTPGPESGNLRGLTRTAIHEACAGRGVGTVERAVPVDEAARATECFITSATREVMPVATLRLPDGVVVRFPEGGGALTRRVAAVYRDYVRDHVDAHRQLALF